MGKKHKLTKATFSGDFEDISQERQLELLDEINALLGDTVPQVQANPNPVKHNKKQKGFTNPVPAINTQLEPDEAEALASAMNAVYGSYHLGIDESPDESLQPVLNPANVHQAIDVNANESEPETPPVKMKAKVDAIPEDEDDGLSELESSFTLMEYMGSDASLVINNPWLDYMKHPINTFSLQPAVTNYDNPTYQEMKMLGKFAAAVLGGPVLVIVNGDHNFQSFLDSVSEFDSEKIMFLSSRCHGTDENGNRVEGVDLLMYIIDDKSREEYNNLLTSMEDPDTNLALDFLFGLYSKVTSRHDNPWSDTDYTTEWIDTMKSYDEDYQYVLDIIKGDEKTKPGSMTFEEFSKKYVLGDISDIFELFRGFHDKLAMFIVNGSSRLKDSDRTLVIPDGFDPSSHVPVTVAVPENNAETTESKDVEVITAEDNKGDIEVVTNPEDVEFDDEEDDTPATQPASKPALVVTGI